MNKTFEEIKSQKLKFVESFNNNVEDITEDFIDEYDLNYTYSKPFPYSFVTNTPERDPRGNDPQVPGKDGSIV